MSERLHGRVAIVTGAARGLGRSIAEALAAEGAVVVAADVRPPDDDTGLDAVACDVTDAGDVARLVDGTIARHGGLDVLVNNAGVSTVAPVEELPESDWDRVLAVNAKGTFLCSRAAVAHMRRRGGGAVVNVASQAGKRGVANIAHYCAAKAAVINFTRALALEVAPAIRVNAICPGIVETPLVTAQLADQARAGDAGEDEIRARWLAEIPLGRFQPAAAVAAAVTFLASDEEAGEITGEALNVAGGMVMH